MQRHHHHVARPARRRSRSLVLVVSAVLLATDQLASTASGQDEDGRNDNGEEQVDHLGLASRLIKDGHYDRAQVTLRQIDETQEGLDLQRLFTLRGLVHLEQRHFAEARDDLMKAVRLGQRPKSEKDGAKPARVEPIVFLYLARAHFSLEHYELALTALDLAGPAATEVPGAFMMRAQSHWELKQFAQALATLARGQRRFPDEPDFVRRRFFYLVDLGLFQEALDLGQRFVERGGATEDDFVAVGEALRQARQFQKAELILETARLRFPENVKLTLQLAHTYLAADDVLSAAMLFEQASLRDPVHTLEAAELYRRAKRLDRALLLNARVLDQSAKMKQRLAITLQLERFEMAAAMEPQLSRLGLLAEDDIRYGLAYAYFKTGDFPAAEQQLKRIAKAEYFGSANDLRKAMETCKEAGWECM